MNSVTLSVAAIGGVILLFGGLFAGDGGSSAAGFDFSVIESLIDTIVNFLNGLGESESA